MHVNPQPPLSANSNLLPESIAEANHCQKVKELALQQLSTIATSPVENALKIPDLIFSIAKECDLESIEQLCSTSRSLSSESSKEELYKKLAIHLGLQPNALGSTRAYKQQIEEYCNKIAQHGLLIVNNLEDDITPNAEMFSPSTLEEVKTLQTWLTAHDNWRTWTALAQAIKQEGAPPRSTLQDIAQCKLIGPEFREWCIKNKDALARVIHLSIESCSLTSLPGEIVYLENLQALSVQGNQLENFPSEVANLRHLQQLNLNNNQFVEIPENVCALVSLQELHLNRNALTTLPEKIGTLVNLKKLELTANQISTFPEEVKDLVQLESLSMASNPGLPNEIATIPNLKIIYISEDQNAVMSEELYLELDSRNVETYYG